MSKYFLSLFCILMVIQTVSAQSSVPGDSIKAQMVRDWERAKTYTNAYLATMPADKFSVRAVDSIRSFSEQMLHLATANIGLTANATGATMLYPGYLFGLEKSPTAQNRDSVSYYVNTSYDFAINSIKNMDGSKLWENTKLFGFSATRYAMLLKAFEHQTHHRGQCTIYIRHVGIKPPQEMLF